MFGNILSSIFSEMEYETNSTPHGNCGCTKCRQNAEQPIPPSWRLPITAGELEMENYRQVRRKLAPGKESHHIHQKAAYPTHFHDKMSAIALTKAQHLGASALQRALNQVLGGGSVGPGTQKRLKPLGISVQATGNGKYPPTPNPWQEDLKAYYGLRAAGLPSTAAYVETTRSARQNDQLRARPTRISGREMEFNF